MDERTNEQTNSGSPSSERDSTAESVGSGEDWFGLRSQLSYVSSRALSCAALFSLSELHFPYL